MDPMNNFPRFSAEEHQSVREDGWVYHAGIVVFSATDFTGQTFHVWCFAKEVPDWVNIRPQHEAGPIQTSLSERLTEAQYLLICLAEECSEVTKRVCKQLRFGSTEVQIGQPHDNAERTAGELDDLLGTHGRCLEAGVLRRPDAGAVMAKIDRIGRFMDYSRSQGVLA
jgi:hypothetical protein